MIEVVWQRIDENTPRDRRVMLWVMGRPEFGFWNDERYAKTPKPFWDWSAYSKQRMRGSQPEWWAEEPAGPVASAEAA